MTIKQRWTAFFAAVVAVLAAIFGVAHTTGPMRLGSIGGGPTSLCPLGWYQPDPNVSQCSTAFGWQPSLSDAATTVATIQGLTPNDDDFVTVLVHVQAPGATDETGRANFRYKWSFTYRADGSAFADPTGATTPTLVESQIGSGLIGTNVTMLRVGSTLQVTTSCATAASCASSGSVDWLRTAPAPWVTAVSPTVAFATPAAPVLLTITTTMGGTNSLAGGGCIVPGAFVGVAPFKACPSSSLPLTGCEQVDETTATCFLPAGSYTAGVDSVCLLSGAQPFCLASGFVLDASGPDTSVPDTGLDSADAADAADSADSADAADSGANDASPFITQIIPNAGTTSQAVTINGGNFATGSGTTFTVTNSAAGQSSLTSVTCATSSSCTAVMPAYGAANGTGGTGSSVTATITAGGATGDGNGSTLGCSGGSNLGKFFYYDSNTAISEYFRADVGITTGSAGTGTVTKWVDNISAINAVNCTNGPTYTVTSLNGSGLPAITTSGTNQCLTYTHSTSGGVESTPFIVARYYSTAAQLLASAGGGNTYFFIGSAAGNYKIVTLDSTVASDTSTHVFVGSIGAGSSGQYAQVDNTVGTLGTPTLGWTGSDVIGCYATGTCTGVNAAHADIGEILVYGARITSAAVARNKAIQAANWCTP